MRIECGPPGRVSSTRTEAQFKLCSLDDKVCVRYRRVLALCLIAIHPFIDDRRMVERHPVSSSAGSYPWR